MKFIDDAIKESEERMEKVDSKKAITSDIDEDLIGFIKKTNIYVVGAGGAGNNTISRLNDIGIEGAETITVNTDAQDLYYSQSDKKILLGRKTSGGLGAGGDPSVGEECAEDRTKHTGLPPTPTRVGTRGCCVRLSESLAVEKRPIHRWFHSEKSVQAPLGEVVAFCGHRALLDNGKRWCRGADGHPPRPRLAAHR